jgi:hypothetical protein
MEITTITRHQQRFASIVTDVLVYVIVLNLFVEYSDAIVIDSFTISIFTAVVLKLLLDVIVAAEHRVSDFFAERRRPISRVARVMTVWLILLSSKFLILEVVDLIFGDHVELGGFLKVMVLVAVMVVAQRSLRRLYLSMGVTDSSRA